MQITCSSILGLNGIAPFKLFLEGSLRQFIARQVGTRCIASSVKCSTVKCTTVSSNYNKSRTHIFRLQRMARLYLLITKNRTVLEFLAQYAISQRFCLRDRKAKCVQTTIFIKVRHNRI